MPQNRLVAYALFCDDVRQEEGDKKTFVGVYGPQLVVPFIPSLIPKFHVVTTLICYHDQLPKSFCVRLTFGNEVIGKTHVSEADLAEWVIAAETLKEEISEFPSDDPPKLRLTVEVYISPFVIRKEGRLAAHVDTDMGSVRAGSIAIVKDANAGSSNALPFPDQISE